MEAFEIAHWIPPIVSPHRKKTAILVLGCLSPVYHKCITVSQKTWAVSPPSDIDIFYVYGGHGSLGREDHASIESQIGESKPELDEMEYYVSGDVIVCGCSDIIQEQRDCLLRKRLIAFDYLANEAKYDYIYTICATSYIDTKELQRYVNSLPLNGVFQGPVGVCGRTGYPFVSGASMLLSRDIAASLAGSASDIIAINNNAYSDDVTFGRWVAKAFCDEPMEEISARIKAGKSATKGAIFAIPYNKGMCNYVGRPSEEHITTDDMYHYHFDSRDIGHMEAFHNRFFA